MVRTTILYTSINRIDIGEDMSEPKIEAWIIIVIVGVPVGLLLLFLLIMLLWAHLKRGVHWWCVISDHIPYDEAGTKVSEPRGLLEASIAVFTSKILICKRCGHRVHWNMKHEVWGIGRT